MRNHHLGILPDCSWAPLATLVKGWRREATLTQAWVWWFVLFFVWVQFVHLYAESIEILKSLRTELVVLTSRPIVVWEIWHLSWGELRRWSPDLCYSLLVLHLHWLYYFDHASWASYSVTYVISFLQMHKCLILSFASTKYLCRN
jgi:hypothetical protein